MKCPICQERLHLVRSDESNNPKTGIKYNREIYVCDKDDVWLTIEVPKAK